MTDAGHADVHLGTATARSAGLILRHSMLAPGIGRAESVPSVLPAQLKIGASPCHPRRPTRFAQEPVRITRRSDQLRPEIRRCVLRAADRRQLETSTSRLSDFYGLAFGAGVGVCSRGRCPPHWSPLNAPRISACLGIPAGVRCIGTLLPPRRSRHIFRHAIARKQLR